MLSGVLVGWHTFVSRMWFGFLLPLLLIAPFAVTMMAPLSAEGRQQVPSSKPPDPEGGEGSGDETPSGGTDELKRQSDELNSKGEVILLENKEETR